MSELENVKVGDRLAVFQYGRCQRIVTVENITKTQILASKGLKYRKKDGFLVGGNTLSGYLCPLNTDIETEIEKKEIISQFKNANWINLPLEKLKQIKQILELE